MSLKDKIETTKTEKSQLEGKLGGLQERLESEHDCETLKQAKIKLKKLQEQTATMKEDLSIQLKRLGTEYEW